jgi:hypothetical protein
MPTWSAYGSRFQKQPGRLTSAIENIVKQTADRRNCLLCSRRTQQPTVNFKVCRTANTLHIQGFWFDFVRDFCVRFHYAYCFNPVLILSRIDRITMLTVRKCVKYSRQVIVETPQCHYLLSEKSIALSRKALPCCDKIRFARSQMPICKSLANSLARYTLPEWRNFRCQRVKFQFCLQAIAFQAREPATHRGVDSLLQKPVGARRFENVNSISTRDPVIEFIRNLDYA